MIVGIIPARFSSEEIECKVLKMIGDKPLIQHVYEACEKSNVLDDILVAADDERILNAVKAFNGKGILTSRSHVCGTDRVAEAARKLMPLPEIVVNIQADEPFIDPEMIYEVICPLQENKDEVMSTLASPIKDEEKFKDPFIVKVVVDFSGYAIYFSRSPIPYIRKEKYKPLQHIGIYCYRFDFLQKLSSMRPSRLELTEGLEQLRVLEYGFKIKVVISKRPYPGICINTPRDLERAQKFYMEISKIHSRNIRP